MAVPTLTVTFHDAADWKRCCAAFATLYGWTGTGEPPESQDAHFVRRVREWIGRTTLQAEQQSAAAAVAAKGPPLLS